MKQIASFAILTVLVLFFHSCEKATIVPPGTRQSNSTYDLSQYGNEIPFSCTDTITLDAGVSNASYLWKPGGETTQTIKIAGNAIDNTLYTVEITYSGSSWIDSAYLNVNYVFYAPNAFTPNGDGVNDLFMVYALCHSDFKLTVYNINTTQKIFETENANVGWDGTYNNKLVKVGQYPYKVDVTFINGQQQLNSGTVQLIR